MINNILITMFIKRQFLNHENAPVIVLFKDREHLIQLDHRKCLKL